MKSSTLPAIRVKPELRQAAENILAKDETLSSFIEESLRAGIRQRKAQHEFIARGLASRDEAQKTGKYYSAQTVFDELHSILIHAEEKTNK